MAGHKQHLVVLVKDVLGAVAMVGVHVDDSYPMTGSSKGSSGHRNVVEQAEAHGPVGRSVMARRSHRAEGEISITGLQPLNGNQPGTSRQPGRHPRIRAHDGVPITSTTSLAIDADQPGEMILQMNAEQVRVGS